MQPIRKLLKLNRNDYHETHLSIVNCILPVKMTPMEIQVLAAFMSLEGLLASHRFSTLARKVVMEKLKLSSGGLSNYIKQLIDKGFLNREEGFISIIPLLIPEDVFQNYMIRLEIAQPQINESNIQQTQQVEENA